VWILYWYFPLADEYIIAKKSKASGWNFTIGWNFTNIYRSRKALGLETNVILIFQLADDTAVLAHQDVSSYNIKQFFAAFDVGGTTPSTPKNENLRNDERHFHECFHSTHTVTLHRCRWHCKPNVSHCLTILGKSSESGG
jgi:hypothetical protein